MIQIHRLALLAVLLPSTTLAQGTLFDLDSPVGENYGKAANAGDVDGDGVNDLIVGAHASTSALHHGRIYIHSGTDGSVIRSVDGSPSFASDPDGHGGFGWSVSALDDINSDGHADFAVGCIGHHVSGSPRGAVHVHSGIDGTELFSVFGQNVGQSETFGFRVSPAGDFNSDGTDDLYVTAQLAETFSIISGVDGSQLQVYSIPINATEMGDLDLDGFLDFADPTNPSSNPTVTIRSGQDGSILHQFSGSPGSWFGSSVGGIEDQNADGHPDFFIGQSNDGLPGTLGRLRVYSGLTGQVLETYVSDLPDIAFGSSTIAAGDVNGDGIEDIAIGARKFNPGGVPSAGRVQVFSGASAVLIATHTGSMTNEYFGDSMFALDDVDGDGSADLGVSTLPAGNPRHIQVYSLFDHLEGQYCSGDEQSCPCANDGGSGGCQNSTGGSARVFGHGSTSVGSDDLTVDGLQLPAGTAALLFAGDTQVNGGAGSHFGDGLRCAGGNIQRMGLRFATSAGSATWGPGLASSAGWTPGDQRFLQVWYRNPTGPCGSGFNTSNAMAVTFTP